MSYVIPFDADEYEARLRKVKKRMESAGIDLLLCTDPANINYLTGLDALSFYVPQILLVHKDEVAPFWLGRLMDTSALQITTRLPEENLLPYPETMLHQQHVHPFQALCEHIQSRGWGNQTIGVEMDVDYYTARCHQTILAGLPNAKIVDNRRLVNWVRLAKSPAELRYMREAGKLTTVAMQEAIDNLLAGKKSYEVAADILRTSVMGTDGLYGDSPAAFPFVMVGENAHACHLYWTDRDMPQNEMVVLELAGVRKRYHCPLARTVLLGKPSGEQRRLADVIIEGVDRALEAAKPGATCGEVENVWQNVLRKNNLSKDSRVGYPVGIAYPPDWGEKTANLQDGDRTVLEPGMCFHFQSGLWLENRGIALSETFAVTESGGERLAHVPHRLYSRT